MEIVFRGKTVDSKWVEGSLVTTNNFIKHMPKQHTKHWIVTSAFGNGGWFNIQRRYYVKTDSLQMWVGGGNGWKTITDIDKIFKGL